MLSRLGAGLALSAALLLAGCEFSKGHSAGSGDSSLPTTPAAPVGFLGGLSLSSETELANLALSMPRFQGGSGGAVAQSSDTDASGLTENLALIGFTTSPDVQFRYDAGADGSYEDTLTSSAAGDAVAGTLSVGGANYSQWRIGAASGEPLDIDGSGGDDGKVYARMIRSSYGLGLGVSDTLFAGVWLYVPDGAGDHEIGAAVDGYRFIPGGVSFPSGYLFNPAHVAGLTGNAVYRGAAVGIYSGGSGVGEFQGAVALTASFVGVGNVSGGMGGFTDAAGNALDGQVSLATAALTAGSNTLGGALSGSGGSFAGAGGSWGARLFGSSGTDIVQPRGIGGTAAGGSSGFYFAAAFLATQGQRVGFGVTFLRDQLLTGEAEIANLAAATLAFESGGGAVSQSSNGSIATRLDVALSGSTPEFTALLDTAAASGFETTVTTSGLDIFSLSRADITLNGLTLQAAEVGERSGLGISWDADAADEGKLYARLFTNRGSSGVSDTNYLAAGVWLFVPDDASADDYAMGAMADGADPFNPANVQGLTGTATYSGSAVGVFSGNGGAGSFEAEMDITADFGANTAPGSVSGTMSNFTGSGGSLAGTLTLGQAALTAGSNTFTGAVSGSGGVFAGASGNWGGRLFNDGNSATDHPGAVAGTVSGGVAADNFYFAGAYIAEKD